MDIDEENEEERVATASSWLIPVEPQIEIKEFEKALEMAESEEGHEPKEDSSDSEEEDSIQAVQELESVLVDKMCEVCGNFFQTFELVNAELNKPLLSTCETCSYYITPPAPAVYGSSDTGKVSTCDKRPKLCARKDKLTRQETNQTVSKKFFCDLCDKSYRKQDNLTEHMRLVHAEEEEHVRERCVTCGSADNIITIDVSENEAESIKLCEACNLSRQEQISKISRTGSKVFPCDLCSRCFSRKDHLTRHRLSHSDVKPFNCYICKKSFSRNDRLVRHIRTHPGAKPFTCRVCSEPFDDHEQLRAHLLTHPKLNETKNSIKCEICRKELRNKNQYHKHMKSHENKTNHCDVCGKSFKLRTSLLAHQKVHTDTVPLLEHQKVIIDTRPFKCDSCVMEFKTKEKYTRHLLVHSSDKYSCKLCSKTFKRKDKLRDHIVVHVDFRPFACEFCDSTFKRKDKYIRHRKHVHNYLSNSDSTSEESEVEDVSYEEIIK